MREHVDFIFHFKKISRVHKCTNEIQMKQNHNDYYYTFSVVFNWFLGFSFIATDLFYAEQSQKNTYILWCCEKSREGTGNGEYFQVRHTYRLA